MDLPSTQAQQQQQQVQPSSVPPAATLSKIPLVARLARFSCSSAASVMAFCQVHSSWRETLIDYGVSEVLFQNLSNPRQKQSRHLTKLTLQRFWRSASKILHRQQTSGGKLFAPELIAALKLVTDRETERQATCENGDDDEEEEEAEEGPCNDDES